MGKISSKNKDDTFTALLNLTDRLRETPADALSLTDIIGVAESLTKSLQPVLRKIDTTLHKELRGILDRIQSLRAEIANVRADDISHNRIPEMGRELSAVVHSTERATNDIMGAAETVLEADSSDPEAYKALVNEKMMLIFEACSFQDLTGQRVTKVVETVEVIESRVGLLCNMLDMEGLPRLPAELSERDKRKKRLHLHGPAAEGEGNNQSAIDDMF